MKDEQFTPLAERYMDAVFRLALSYTRSAADAEDVTQTALLALYRTDTHFESELHVKNWLMRVTVNECRKLFRALWRRHEDIADYAESLALPEPEQRELLETVMALPVKYRTVLYLYYYEQYSTAEIAAILSISAATVRTRLARGREMLKTILSEEECI